MPEHPIRLRGGWELHPPTAGGVPEKVALPLDGWPPQWGPARLVRRFQTPPLDPDRETLWLRLDAVPGLRAVTLNGHPLATDPLSGATVLLPLGAACSTRNVLELVVEPCRAAVDRDLSPWGEIALVVRSEA